MEKFIGTLIYMIVTIATVFAQYSYITALEHSVLHNVIMIPLFLLQAFIMLGAMYYIINQERF